MRVPLVWLFAISVSSAGLAAQAAGRIDARSVWPGGADPAPCRAVADDSRQRACLAELMRRHGATPQAAAFTRRFRGVGYVSQFRALGRVSLAVATSPFMANSNDRFLLVNGRPAIVDVAAQASDRRLGASPLWRAFRRTHPDADLWPLDGDFAGVERRRGGGQRFVFTAPFKTCHACAIVARARLAYDFDRAGAFRGLRLLSISP